MKIMRKVLTALVCVALAASIFGCGKDSKSDRKDDDKPTSNTEEIDETKEDNGSKEAEEDGNKPQEEFTGFTDPTIKMMAEDYKAKDMVVNPVMASDIGASDYNYVEGFRMYAPSNPDAYMLWLKFKKSEDGVKFVQDVWIKDCKGYTAYEQAGSYFYTIDGLYTGSVMNNGLMQCVPYEDDGRKSNATAEDFNDPKLIDLCKEYEAKGFVIQKEESYEGFIAYGVNDEHYHIAVICIKFKDKDSAVKYVNEILGPSSLTTPTLNDNADGSISVNIIGDPQYVHTGSMEGTIDETGLLVISYTE